MNVPEKKSNQIIAQTDHAGVKFLLSDVFSQLQSLGSNLNSVLVRMLQNNHQIQNKNIHSLYALNLCFQIVYCIASFFSVYCLSFGTNLIICISKSFKQLELNVTKACVTEYFMLILCTSHFYQFQIPQFKYKFCTNVR